MPWKTMPHCTSWEMKHLRFLLKTLLLFGAINVSQVKGQSAVIAAPAFGNSPSGNMFVTYFGDSQNTSAIGADRTLPQCQGGDIGQPNLNLKLENTNTGLVLQQVGPFTSVTGFLWDIATISTLTSLLNGLYVCRLYQNSMLLATSALSYQLNVVVPMNITCTFPASLNIFSMNVLSCNVNGYPQPIVSWSGNNQTIPGNQIALDNGTMQITSTASFEGNKMVSDAGDFVTINVTAQYPPFNCTPLQNPSTQWNFCDAIPKSVTYSKTLQVVDRCPAFTNASWSPTTSNISDYQTRINISCAPGYTGNSPLSVFCQANGSWTAFPNCTDDACLLMPCHDTSAACRDTGNRNFTCDCPAGTTGDGEMEGGCVTVRRTTATTQYQATEPSASPSSSSSATATTSTNLPIQPITSANTSTSATASTTSPATLDNGLLQVWIIPSAVAVGVLLLFLIVLLIACYLKRRVSPSPRKPTVQAPQKTPQADLTMNTAYEDATTLSNAMTESSAYGLAGVPNQPNYDFIQPTQPIEYDYVTPR